MKATIVAGAIPITVAQMIEGQLVLETDCSDFDHYKRLPSVVSYNGTICTKTGWSSDRNYACYKSKGGVAYAVKETSERDEILRQMIALIRNRLNNQYLSGGARCTLDCLADDLEKIRSSKKEVKT